MSFYIEVARLKLRAASGLCPGKDSSVVLILFGTQQYQQDQMMCFIIS